VPVDLGHTVYIISISYLIMPSKEVIEIAARIKSLKIRGARNVSGWAVKAMALEARASKAKSPEALWKELFLTADYIAGLRPTEPMLQNSLRNALRATLLEINRARTSRANIRTIRDATAKFGRNYEKHAARNLELISLAGAQLVDDGDTILTHCHSSTVEGILKQAKLSGKKFRVIATETRPKFQGHITMSKLSAAGIPVTAIVDSAVSTFIKDCDKVFVGADAINSTGDLINKIGTLTIAHLADDYGVEFYSAAELYKYDLLTQWGAHSLLEERSPDEVLDTKKFRKVKVRNPAFDVTPARFITGYITEKGLYAPQALPAVAREVLKI